MSKSRGKQEFQNSSYNHRAHLDEKEFLKFILSRENITYQHRLIAQMTPNLEIKLSAFRIFPLLASLGEENLIAVIKQIDFLKIIERKHQQHIQKYVLLNYSDSSRTILVTGMNRKFLENAVSDFNKQYFHYMKDRQDRTASKIAGQNGYWTAIELYSNQMALIMKKYLRSKKNILDLELNSVYKAEEKRKVRIIIMHEDFYTLLVDSMCEERNQQFKQKLAYPELPERMQKRASGEADFSEKKKSKSNKYVIQAKFGTFNLPKDVYYKIWDVSSRVSKSQSIHQEDFSDGFSENTSLNSQIYDQSKIKELIETSEQGIQAENENIIQGELDSFTQSPSMPNSTNQLSNNVGTSIDQLSENMAVQSRGGGFRQSAGKIVEEDLVQRIQAKNQLQTSIIAQNEVQNNQVSKFLLLAQENAIEENIKQIILSESLMNQQRKSEAKFMPTPFFLQQQSQTVEGLYTILKFSTMKKLSKEFQKRKHSYHVLKELPDYILRESDSQRNRHLFFDSLCRPRLARRGESDD